MAELYASVCYCTNLRRAANAVTEFYDAELKESGLTVAQYYLLVNLSRMGSANITHWSQRVGLERSTMVRNIKPLHERGLIESLEGHGKVFTLSEAGKRALKIAVPLWEQAQRRMEELLGEDAQAIMRIAGSTRGQ